LVLAALVSGWLTGCATPQVAGGAAACGASLKPLSAPPAGGQSPRTRLPGCVAANVRLPAGFEGLITSVGVEAEVGADGCLGRIGPVTDFPDRFIRYAVEEAVRSCVWEPGRDEQGKPVDMLVRVAVRFKPG
jgi:hypothetical protein